MTDAVAIAAVALGADPDAPPDTTCTVCRAAIVDAERVVHALSAAGWIIAQPAPYPELAPRHHHRHL